MSKIFETSDDIVETIERKFEELDLNSYGLNLKVMSLTKAKEILKVTRASATTQFIAKKDDMITVFVYEAAFDRLPDDAKEMLVDTAFSGISYDFEKDKVNLENNPVKLILNGRKKFGDDILNKVELGYLIIDEIEEEEKAKKEAEKEAKKAAKNNNH